MLNADIVWAVVRRPALLGLLALTLLVAWPLGGVLARRSGRPRVLGVAFVVILGAVLAATTTTGDPAFPDLDGVRAYAGRFGDLSFHHFAGTPERWANIGLFLPVGVVATLLWFRPGRHPGGTKASGSIAVAAGSIAVVAGSAAVFSLAIELWQALIGRGGDPVDVLHNTAGAALGIALALPHAGRRRRGSTRPTRRV